MSIIEGTFVDKDGRLVKTFSDPSLANRLSLVLQEMVNDHQWWGWPGAAVWGVGTVLVVEWSRLTWFENDEKFKFEVIVKKEPRSLLRQGFGALIPMLTGPKADNVQEQVMDITLRRLAGLIRKTWIDDGFVGPQAIKPGVGE